MTWYTFDDEGVPSIYVKLEMNDAQEEVALADGSIMMMSFEFGDIRSFYNEDITKDPRTRYYFHAELENGQGESPAMTAEFDDGVRMITKSYDEAAIANNRDFEGKENDWLWYNTAARNPE